MLAGEAIDHQSSILTGNSNGVVAKWEGKGLQNPDHGFKSRRRLYQEKRALSGSFFILHPTISTLIPLCISVIRP